jgi:hypothetical protein
MLGIFNLLPLLKGWDYKIYDYTRTVRRGTTQEVLRTSSTGWLINTGLITNDLRGGTRFKFQGSDLSLNEFSFTPYEFLAVGTFMQDPSGWIQLCYQPNPYSTAGAFYCGYSGGWQGFMMPFVPTTIIELYLETESTQLEAIIRTYDFIVEITNKELFIKSLRSLLGMPTIQEIDPALLVPGPAELTVKGALEKKGGT